MFPSLARLSEPSTKSASDGIGMTNTGRSKVVYIYIATFSIITPKNYLTCAVPGAKIRAQRLRRPSKYS